MSNFIDAIILAASQVVSCVKDLYKCTVDKFSNLNSRNITVNAVVKYSEITSSWNTFWKTSYNTNIRVKNSIDTANYVWRFLKSIVTNDRIEPLASDWTSVSKLIRNCDEPFIFYENYYYASDLNCHDANSFLTYYLHLPEVIAPHECKCLIMKNVQDQYLVKAIKINKHGLVISKQPSNVKFLSIEYSHPTTNVKLQLSLDPGMYIEFNELFAPVFVLRLLEYQHNNRYYFDMDYTLTLMDNNINFIELSSNDYVMLEKDSYKLKTFV